MNAFAHVVVTEDLVDHDFVAERCDTASFREWLDFARDATNSPEAVSDILGVPAEDIRAAARLYATGGRAAIYYGLGVTEHSQGSTMVMAMANLAMATGNIGGPGVGVNPLRGQNNVQGSCDVGSFPHEFSGYRPVADDAVRAEFVAHWQVDLDAEPGYRIPNMLDQAVAGTYKGIYIQGEDIAQSDPNTQHVEAALGAMECVVVQDLFLNETAKFAHVFLPGTSFLEKDGTFINAERRINRVRAVMPSKAGMQEWEATQALANAMGYPMAYTSVEEILAEIAELTPIFAGVTFDLIDREGSVQWPCNDTAPLGTPVMHQEEFVRGKGRFMVTEYQPTPERANRKFPLLLTTGRILTQYNVGAQTRRTDNVEWLDEDVLEIHPADAETRGVRNEDWVSVTSRIGEITLRAKVTKRVVPGVVYTTFHHPETGTNVVTTELSDWATNCPEYKVTAVEVRPANHRSQWQDRFADRAEAQAAALAATGPSARSTSSPSTPEAEADRSRPDKARDTPRPLPEPFPRPRHRRQSLRLGVEYHGRDNDEDTDLVTVEEPMEIRLGFHGAEGPTEQSISVTMRTPGNDFDLAVGFLFTEGVIADPGDVQKHRALRTTQPRQGHSQRRQGEPRGSCPLRPRTPTAPLLHLVELRRLRQGVPGCRARPDTTRGTRRLRDHRRGSETPPRRPARGADRVRPHRWTARLRPVSTARGASTACARMSAGTMRWTS